MKACFVLPAIIAKPIELITLFEPRACYFLNKGNVTSIFEKKLSRVVFTKPKKAA